METLNDKNSGKDREFRALIQKEIWKEILLYCHHLKNDYIRKNNMMFNGIYYKNYFVKIEFKATYSRRNFIIKFLSLFNGMNLIQNKLSIFEGRNVSLVTFVIVICYEILLGVHKTKQYPHRR